MRSSLTLLFWLLNASHLVVVVVVVDVGDDDNARHLDRWRHFCGTELFLLCWWHEVTQSDSSM